MSESERDLQHAQDMKALQQERRAERATKTLRGGLLIPKHPYQAGYKAQRGVEF